MFVVQSRWTGVKGQCKKLPNPESTSYPLSPTAQTHRLSRSGGAGHFGVGRTHASRFWANPESIPGVVRMELMTSQRLGSVPTTEIRAAWKQSRSSGNDIARAIGSGGVCMLLHACAARAGLGVVHPPVFVHLVCTPGENLGEERESMKNGRSLPLVSTQWASEKRPRGQSGPRFSDLRDLLPLGPSGNLWDSAGWRMGWLDGG